MSGLEALVPYLTLLMTQTLQTSTTLKLPLDLPSVCVVALTVNNLNYPGPPPQSGAVVLSDDLKNPAIEKLDLVRKWSINTYKVTFHIFICVILPLTRVHLVCKGGPRS